MSVEQQLEELLLQLARDIREQQHGMRARAMHGGVFEYSNFMLATQTYTDNGLHAVTYFVIHNPSGAAFATHRDKATCIGAAREAITAIGKWRLNLILGRIQQRLEAEVAERVRAESVRADEQRKTFTKVRSIPRRRKQIFDAAEGKCHYCSTALTLDGKWHIEHKMPKALLGSNEPSNLVASCAPCNFKKRDRTDVEFTAKLEKGVAA
jgi:5-methylcytosine-specific restriction endonuclease McrA